MTGGPGAPHRREAIVLSGARTPFAKAYGALARVPAQILAASAMREAIARAEIDPQEIDAVILGNVAGPFDAPNIARVASLLCGIPQEAPAHTVNRNCASGLEAIVQAVSLVGSGEAGCVVAGGVESMSSVPFVFAEEARDLFLAARRARSFPARLRALARLRPSHFRPVPGLALGLVDPCCGLSMGETAEILAAEFEVTREEQDAFALESHRRATAAASRLAEEIAPLPTPSGSLVVSDTGPRADASMEALARLRPAFDRSGGSITAGNASPITDGAAAVVIVSAERASRARPAGGPLGSVRSWAAKGLDPRRMGLGPARAIPEALERAGARFDQIDLFEINEAFAAQVIACTRALPPGAIPGERLNVNGGAIALGHPVGASGARLVLTLLMEMRRRRARRGCVSLCVGGGQGMAALLEGP